MPKAIVLGAGMVGRVMAADLVRERDFEVTIADLDLDALDGARAHAGDGVRTMQADLSDPERVTDMAKGHDIVIGALASRIGFQTLRAVIDSRRPFVDICFMPEDAWELDAYARERGTTAVFDMGVAPGTSSMLAAHAATELDECERIDIYVGGLPQQRRWPFEYKAAFSPGDVIEEYVRPSRIVEHGEIVVREALSEPELIDLPGVGTLEAFNTDGLRSLATSRIAPFMREKTLRYPGHIELMRVLRTTGLFSEKPVEVAGQMVKPRDVIQALMFPHWTYEEGEGDLTVMRVQAEGLKGLDRIEITWDLLDHYDPERGETSMARTTGFPCTSVARMLALGQIVEPGVLAPERLASTPGVVRRILDDLAERGVRYRRTERKVSGPAI